MTTERITDDNGDELEHGEPDFPGQFPEPAGLDVSDLLSPEAKSALDANLREMARTRRVGNAAAATLPLGAAASPADGAEPVSLAWKSLGETVVYVGSMTRLDEAEWDGIERHHRPLIEAALAASPADGAGVDDAQVIEWLREALGFSEEWSAIARELVAAQRAAALEGASDGEKP